ncbi:hypothetical protein L9F63_023791, partial [Diploptera punctata]
NIDSTCKLLKRRSECDFDYRVNLGIKTTNTSRSPSGSLQSLSIKRYIYIKTRRNLHGLAVPFGFHYNLCNLTKISMITDKCILTEL